MPTVSRLWLLIPGLLLTLGLGALRTQAQGTDPEREYWLTQAALLDPAAYEVCAGTEWSRTVPEGEEWRIVSSGSLAWSGAPTKRLGYLRSFDVADSIAVPSGATFGAATGQTGSALICKPSLVAGEPRYCDPKALYYERLARLRTLPLRLACAEIPNNSPPGTTASVALPDDFAWGWIVAASVYNGSWVTLSGWNLMPEINNRHAVRFARAGGAPFCRALMGTFIVQGGSVSGEPAATYGSGNGALWYQALPVDW